MKATATNPVLIPTILCGGVGSRLWPVSREQHPKPFIRLDDGNSLLQKVFLRASSLPNVGEIVTVTNRELLLKTEEEYREFGSPDRSVNTSFILEPFGRNTAPAIAAATLQAAESHGDGAILLVLPADHLISDQSAFASAVASACDLAQAGKLVTFGIQPTGAETGYGYIESDGHEVVRFIEKPPLEKAQSYFTSGNFLWNSGMFCFTVGTMLREMAEHCPDILNATRNCLDHSQKRTDERGCSRSEISPEDFKAVPDDSIDYSVMEKTENAAVVACDIGWSDIGCWQALGALIPVDSNNNRIQGEVVLQDSSNCIIKSENRVIGVVGVKNHVIIDTPDALLIADRDRAQDVKHIYAKLKKQEHESHKLHRTVQTPWGTYTVIEEGPNFKIKRIEVKPGASLSLQMHHHRSEHWVVVSGTADVRNGDKELVLKLNESTFIPAKHKHRLENSGLDPLVMIEVQTGDYLGEDDIVRFEDIYGRINED